MTTDLRGFLCSFFCLTAIAYQKERIFFLLSVGYLKIRHTCTITLIVLVSQILLRDIKAHYADAYPQSPWC